MSSKRITIGVLASIVVLVAAGCPREQDEPLVDDTGSATAEPGSGGTADSTITASTTDDPSPGSTSGGEECQGPDGCYDCTPTTPAQVLDACTDATCSAFPNTAERLPRLERDGTLPPIP